MMITIKTRDGYQEINLGAKLSNLNNCISIIAPGHQFLMFYYIHHIHVHSDPMQIILYQERNEFQITITVNCRAETFLTMIHLKPLGNQQPCYS